MVPAPPLRPFETESEAGIAVNGFFHYFPVLTGIIVPTHAGQNRVVPALKRDVEM